MVGAVELISYCQLEILNHSEISAKWPHPIYFDYCHRYWLVRFSPVLMRATQSIAIGARGYWWAILPFLVISWIIWRFRRRRMIADESEYRFESQRIRDVTDNAESRLE